MKRVKVNTSSPSAKPCRVCRSRNRTESGYCRPCRRRAQKKYDRTEKGRLQNRIGRYGLTRAQYRAMLEAQSGKCYFCARPPKVVDHDHKTGRVRGLLCLAHNTALGQFRDSVYQLKRAIKYLERRA